MTPPANTTGLAVFEERKIRRVYDEATETWFFSVVDIVAALIEQPDYQAARNYWKVLKNRLKKEGSQSVTKCNRLKLTAEDGKKYHTALAELSTRQIAESAQAQGLEENACAGKKGGGIAKKARQELEEATGQNVVTGENFLGHAGKKAVE